MQSAIVLQPMQRIAEREISIEFPPLAGVAHPVDIEPIDTHPRQARKGRIEFLASIVAGADPIALDEAIAARRPFPLDGVIADSSQYRTLSGIEEG